MNVTIPRVNPALRTYIRSSGGMVLLFGLMLQAEGSRIDAMEDDAFADAFDELSLEDLLNIRVISVTKKEQDLYDTAAAIYVMSNEELQRSGITSIADCHAAGAGHERRVSQFQPMGNFEPGL